MTAAPKSILLLLLASVVSILSSCGSISTIAGHNARPRTQAVDAPTAGVKLTAAALRSTVLAAIRQPITTTRQGLAVFWHRPREIVAGNLPFNPFPIEPLPDAPGTASFERLLDKNKLPEPKAGSLKWLVDGPGFFGELDRQTAAAKKDIDIQVYIFDNDDVAVHYADSLRKRSEEVTVRVLYDDLGTTTAHLSSPRTLAPIGFNPPALVSAYLEDGSQVDVRRSLNPWLVADHTKLLVFDNRTAIIGGMNIGREYYSEWHDLMVRLEGPVVTTLAGHFQSNWRRNAPLGDLGLLSIMRKLPEIPTSPGDIPIRVIVTDPGVGKHEILDATLLAIQGARKRVWIETPYFASTEILQALESACRRGVDVRVIIPAAGDSAIMDLANLATARTIILAGGKVQRYPGMTHMKVMICDGWATVGSANLDTLSMRINRELNIAFSDPKAVRSLERAVFQPDFRRSKQIRLSDTESAIAPLAAIIATQL